MCFRNIFKNLVFSRNKQTVIRTCLICWDILFILFQKNVFLYYCTEIEKQPSNSCFTCVTFSYTKLVDYLFRLFYRIWPDEYPNICPIFHSFRFDNTCFTRCYSQLCDSCQPRDKHCWWTCGRALLEFSIVVRLSAHWPCSQSEKLSPIPSILSTVSLRILKKNVKFAYM